MLSAFGLAVGLSVGFLMLGPAEALVGMFLVVPVAFGVSGAILGASQWPAVRYLARAGRWIAWSALGLAAGLTIGTVAIETVGGWIAGEPVRFRTASLPALAAAFATLGAISGLTLGAAQWRCLGRPFAGAGGWIAANAISLALGMLVGLAVAELLAGGVRSSLGIVTLFTVAASASGAVTGRALESRAREAARSFRLTGT